MRMWWILWHAYYAKSLVMGTGSTEDQYGAMVLWWLQGLPIDHKDSFLATWLLGIG